MNMAEPVIISICHLGWTEKDFENMWERLAQDNPYKPMKKQTPPAREVK